MKTFYLVGLGNPGTKYEKTRHNAGFLVVDALVRELHAPEFKLKKSAHALVSETEIREQGTENNKLVIGNWSLVIVKPQTFMNLSGKSVAALISKLRHFDISTSLLVVSDDLDLPLGTIRMRESGGAGGHQGLQSIIDALGTEEFPRLKIGIRPPSLLRQPGKAEEFVLKKFTREELALMNHQIIPQAINEITERIKKLESRS